MTKIFLLRILILFGAISFAQDSIIWNSKKDKIKIPFELSHNLMIVDVVFNGVKLKMIADTGAEKNILFAFPEKDSITLHEASKMKVSGVGAGDAIEAYISNSNRLEINNYKDFNFQILLIPNQEINIVNKLGIPINGVLGSSFFKSFITEINYDKKILFLHKKLPKNVVSYNKTDVLINNNKAYINVDAYINNTFLKLKLLYDTGLSDGLWLFKDKEIIINNKSINDILGRGLSGDITGERSRVDKVVFDNFEMKEVLVAYPDSTSFKQIEIIKGRNGSLGGEVTKRFNWILDYKNNKFYFKKNNLFYEPFNFNMSGIEVQHSGMQLIKEELDYSAATSKIALVKNENNFNFSQDFRYELKPVFEIYSIRKDSPADKIGIKVGDILKKINGVSSYNLSIQKITDLFTSEDGKQITIVVDRKGKILTFKFKLEKIL